MTSDKKLCVLRSKLFTATMLTQAPNSTSIMEGSRLTGRAISKYADARCNNRVGCFSHFARQVRCSEWHAKQHLGLDLWLMTALHLAV